MSSAETWGFGIVALILTVVAILLGWSIKVRRLQLAEMRVLIARSERYVAALQGLSAAVCNAASMLVSQLNALTGALVLANQTLRTAIATGRRLNESVAALKSAIEAVEHFIHTHFAIFAAFGLVDRMRAFNAKNAAPEKPAPPLGLSAQTP